MASLPSSMTMSPRPRKGDAAPEGVSLFPSSQATKARGSTELTSTGPENDVPSTVVRRPLIWICVKPGALTSTPFKDRPPAAATTSPRSDCSTPPPRVTPSIPKPICTGMGQRDKAGAIAARALTALAGSRRGRSCKDSARSRSIWRADTTASTRGLSPKIISAVPVALIARSSGPYCNSRCSNRADAGVALTREVMRQGSAIAVLPSPSATPTGRVSVTVPSKRGVPSANDRWPSLSARTATSEGSRLSLILASPSSERAVEMR